MNFLFFILWILCPAHHSAEAVPFKGQKIVVSGPSPYLPKIVKEIYQSGGNVFDCAVAGALSLSVTHPYYVSFGSGGFALLKKDGQVEAIDFRERAPKNMKPDFYITQGLSSQTGGAAVGVPGFLAGLYSIHKSHGKLPWKRLTAPALQLARKGFPVSGDGAEMTLKWKKNFNPTGRRVFMKGDKVYLPGDILKQPLLAKALRRIQKNPVKAFYKGPLGRDVLKTVRENKGIMTENDLHSYRVRRLKPVSISFRGYQIHSMPLPSSGGIILSLSLKLIEKQKLRRQALYSGEELHLLGEIMARAFRVRSLMGDPDNFKDNPSPGWLSEKHINTLNQTLSLKTVRPLPPLTDWKEEGDTSKPHSQKKGETTHISLMDHRGSAVAMTLTLNGPYGSGLVTEKYGIVLNNQMDDFTTLPGRPNMYKMLQGRKNQVRGGRAPLSSMTPVIAEQNGKTVLALGGAGGPMIINGVLQTLYRYTARGLNIEEAIQAPRIHHQFFPGKLFVEENRFGPETILQLKMKGHRIQYRTGIARVFGVAVDRKTGWLSAGRENRRESHTGGY